MLKITEQLQTLRLGGMSRMWQSLIETRQYQGLSLSEGLDILLQAEAEERQNKRLERLQKAAEFRYRASVEEINFTEGRTLDKNTILHLSTCEYINQGEAVLISGATGAGKSFIASALGHQACLLGYTVTYFNTQKLLQKIKISKADGTIFKLMEKLARRQLLIIDDFGLSVLDNQQRIFLMEIMEDRHGKNATIIASQLPIANWYEVIGDDTIADAIMDRLIHRSHKIELKGKSLRNNR